MKLFDNHGGIYRLRKKFNKDSGEIKPLGVHRNMIISNQQCVYFFVDPDLRMEIILRKEKATESWGIDFKID